MKKIGSRWFLSPGRISTKGGVGVLDDTGEEVVATMFNLTGESVWRETLTLKRTARLRVQGET